MTDSEKFDLILDKMGAIDNRLGIIALIFPLW